MAPKQHVEQQIGIGWGHHRSGNNDQAISEFEQVLSLAPDSIDAYYGLGLARRDSGNTDGAIEAFQKAFQITSESLEATKKVSDAKGAIVGSSNNLETSDDDRYMMMTRMIAQRLDELGVKVELNLKTLP